MIVSLSGLCTRMYYGISWYIALYYGIFWYSMVYSGILWYAFYGVLLYVFDAVNGAKSCSRRRDVMGLVFNVVDSKNIQEC